MNVPTLPDPSTNELPVKRSENMSGQNHNIIDTRTMLLPNSGKHVQPNISIATNQMHQQSHQELQMIRSS